MSSNELSFKQLAGGPGRSKTTLTGKCQRIAISTTETVEHDQDTRHNSQRKVSASDLMDFIDENVSAAPVTSKTKKSNLSKYMDDNIRNFDPLAKRKERSSTCSSGENTTHSTESNSRKIQITENSLTDAVKENENIKGNQIAHSPEKSGVAKEIVEKSKHGVSKFSVDAVDSPQKPPCVAPIAPAKSALANALARSSNILARSSKTVVPPGREATNDAAPGAPAASAAAAAPTKTSVPSKSLIESAPVVVKTSTFPKMSQPVAAPVATSSDNHTSTNTHAPTQAFKTNIDNEPVSLETVVPKLATAVDPLEVASRQKRVSFIAPNSAPDPAPIPQSAKKVPTSHSKSSVSRKVAQGQVFPEQVVSSELSAAQPISRPAGILSDPSRFIELNGRQYIRLNVLGKGGSSCVYRIIGADDGQVYAYKRVEVRDSEDVDSVFDSYANEIALLRRLSAAAHNASETTPAAIAGAGSNSTPTLPHQSSRIIELIDFEVRRDQRYIAMVLEAGDIDLAKVLTQKNTRSVSSTGVVGSCAEGAPQALLDPFFARMAWREMLEAVDHIHQHRIVHGDLKPANFVFVKGHLKLIDFGIAKSFNSDTTNIYRESQIGTINYMAPEAIAPMSAEETEAHPSSTNDNERLKMRLGRASDIWSLGCILYQMVYGRPPFAALNTIQKLSMIPNPNHVIKYPDWGDADAIDSMKACLKHDARLRSKIKGPGGLLELPYLQVPHNTAEEKRVINTDAATSSSTQQNYAIGKEQVQCIVGAVLDSLHNTAQQGVAKAQPSGRGVRTTRSGKLSAEAEAAQRLAQGIVQWIDEVDQGSIEEEVMLVVKEQDWPVPESVSVTAAPPTLVAHSTTGSVEPTASISISHVASQRTTSTAQKPSVIAPTIAMSPSSPYVPSKRKAEEIQSTPKSVTRSASKAKRAALDHHSGPDTARKSLYPSTASKTPSHASTLRPTFLHSALGAAKIPAFPSLLSVPTPSRSHSAGNVAPTRRSPLKAMPLSLQQQILHSAAQRNSENNSSGGNNVEPAVDRAAKWMRPQQQEENNDMRSVVEKRLSMMRKFMNTDQDNNTVTETMTGFVF